MYSSVLVFLFYAHLCFPSRIALSILWEAFSLHPKPFYHKPVKKPGISMILGEDANESPLLFGACIKGHFTKVPRGKSLSAKPSFSLLALVKNSFDGKTYFFALPFASKNLLRPEPLAYWLCRRATQPAREKNL